MRRTSPWLVLVLSPLAGCDGTTIPKCDMGTWNFGESASVTGVSCQDRLLACVWCDAPFTGMGRGYSARPGRADFSTTVMFKEGEPLRVKTATTDGKTWVITVNGTDYRPEDGPIFLVRTRDKAAPVTQVKHDLLERPAGPETWEQLRAESLEIQAFLARAEGKK